MNEVSQLHLQAELTDDVDHSRQRYIKTVGGCGPCKVYSGYVL